MNWVIFMLIYCNYFAFQKSQLQHYFILRFCQVWCLPLKLILLKSCSHDQNILKFKRPAAIYLVTLENKIICGLFKVTKVPKSCGAVIPQNTTLLWLVFAPLLINAGTIKKPVISLRYVILQGLIFFTWLN